MSLFTPWNCFASCPGAARLKPVLTGSMNTRSVTSRIEFSLSTTRPGGGPPFRPSASRATIRGPKAPMCTQSEAAPGPPLKLKVTGRVVGSFTPSRV